MQYLDSLNEKQKEAVLYTDGPLLIVAGAGAGKTKTLTHRIIHLIHKGINPESILAVTFTNKAAKEMRDRVMGLLESREHGVEIKEVGVRPDHGRGAPFVSTFHSLGVYIIKENAHLIGLNKYFTIIDESDAMSIIKSIMKDRGIDPKQHEPRKIKSVISKSKGDFITAQSFGENVQSSFQSIVSVIWREYEAQLKKEKALDFDDLLLETVLILKKYPEIKLRYQEKWKYLHIDEYQDTNEVQYEMTKLLVGKDENICVVGDTDQCLTKGTKITMSDGTLKPIEQIKKGDSVLSNYGSHDFRKAKVIKTRNTQSNGKLICIETINGETITSTPNHIHFAGYRLEVTPQSSNSNRININVTLCADRRGSNPMHLISMFGNDIIGKEKLESLGLSVRPAKKNTKNWRFETVRADYGEVCLLAIKIASIFPDAQLVFSARLGGKKSNIKDGNSLPQLPASSVVPGMALFGSNGYDIVSKVSRISASKQKVFDLDVERTHNFIANGIVTHNCIYSWRGANIKNLIHFEKDFPNAKIVMLEQNYRSTKNIIEAANSIIEKNQYRVPKILFTENVNGEEISICEAYDEQSEALFVAEKIDELIKENKPEDIAILYRANFQSRVLEEALLNKQIPYQVLGVKFFERKEIKDLLAYIRSAYNKDSLSDIKRIINVPARGIGKVTLLKLFANRFTDLPVSMQEKINKFYLLLDDIHHYVENHKPSESIKYIIEKTGLEEILKHGSSDEQEDLENMKELVSLALKYDNLEYGMEQLLEDAALSSDQDTLIQKGKGVRLMTVHASKGLEFKYVFVTGLEQDLFPHTRDNTKTKEDKEEERRLFYVAITRAREKLFLSYATLRTIFGMKQVNSPSEFIYDIPAHLTIFEQAHSSNGEKIVYL